MSGASPGGGGDTRTDAELIAAHLQGDREAFGEVVRRHRDRAWAVAVRTLGDPAEAEDAVQDAFVSALRGAGSFRAEAQVSTWLHRIVVNACLDRLRRKASRPQVPLDEDHDVSDPVDRYDARETGLAIEGALAQLPAEQRLAIVLVDVEGHTIEAAAALLGVADGTVKSRCSRGRAKLAVSLGYLRPGNPRATARVTGAAAEPSQEGGATA